MAPIRTLIFSLAVMMGVPTVATGRQCGIFPQPIITYQGALRGTFGLAIDTDSERLIVGLPRYTPPGGASYSGAACIFRKDAVNGWVQEAFLIPPGLEESDQFGYSVAIDGDVAVASSPFNQAPRGEGRAFVYRRSPTGVWSLETSFVHFSGMYGAFGFGYGVAVNQDRVAVTGPQFGLDVERYCDVYDHRGGTWRRVAHLVPPEGGAALKRVVIDNEWMLVFTPGFLSGGGARGYWYKETESGWVYMQTLELPPIPPIESGNYEIAMDRELVVVGSGSTDGSLNLGAAWVYRRFMDEWVHETTLRPPDDVGDRPSFGSDVAVAGNLIVVGAAYAATGGAALVYEESPVGWVEKGRVRRDDFGGPMQSLGSLGLTVAAYDSVAFIGAPNLRHDNPDLMTGAIIPVDIGRPTFAIARQPKDISAMPGDTVAFSVAAASPDPLFFQWRRNGSPLSDGGRITGSRSDALTIRDATNTDTALYDAEVISPTCGSLFTRSALLEFGDCIEFTRQPQGQMAPAGGPVVLSCEARSYLPLAYRWYRAGTPITDDERTHGSDTATLILDSTVPSDGSYYRVFVSNACGERQSQDAVVAFMPCVEITQQPEEVVTFVGNTVRFHVAAIGPFPLTHQWRRDARPLEDSDRVRGSRTPTLTLVTSAGFSGIYTCLISCGFTETISQPASLVLQHPGCLGDANGDRVVNMVDVSSVLELWGAQYGTGTGPGDANRDARVSFADISIVLGLFGHVCGP